MKSKIFTSAEIAEIQKRYEGDKSTRSGIFFNRIKPKIMEILHIWLPMKDDLRKILKEKKGARK